jgi:hypothetical protein
MTKENSVEILMWVAIVAGVWGGFFYLLCSTKGPLWQYVYWRDSRKLSQNIDDEWAQLNERR